MKSLRLVRTILRKAGYRVYAASTVTKGIEYFEHLQSRISLVITDVVLPGMSGPDMLREMLTTRPDVRVLFISGYGQEIIESRVTDL